MSILDLYPSKYLKVADIEEGMLATITSIIVETVGNDGSQKPTIRFKELPKPAVLNVTNAKAIAAVYGEDENAWRGRKVNLHAIRVQKPGGGIADSIAMSPAKASMAKELDDEIAF
jgi:hypothetical protein